MGIKILTVNRRAHHDFFLEETYEAGLVLTGSEVKSAKEGRISIKGSYAEIKNGEAFLKNCHISPYTHAKDVKHDPLRDKKLLLHKSEIKRLQGKVAEKGYTLIPTKVYVKNGWIKVEIALAKGKKVYDKREDLKRKTQELEVRKYFKEKFKK